MSLLILAGFLIMIIGLAAILLIVVTNTPTNTPSNTSSVRKDPVGPGEVALPRPPGYDPGGYEPPSKIPGEYKEGATVGTNKAGLKYGDLAPYSKCKIQYKGEWRHMKGQAVGDQGYSDGQNWSVRFPMINPTNGKEVMGTYNNFLSDYSGPKLPDFADTIKLVLHRTNRDRWEEMLDNGVEMPPWMRSGPLAPMDLIKQYCP